MKRLAALLLFLMMTSAAMADPLPMRDAYFHTPNESSERLCDHDFCFWQMNEGETDESLVWEVLTQPITVLKGGQKDQIRVRAKPDAKCEEYVGVVTCDSQGVHVLAQEGDWSLIEAYSSAVEGSPVKVWAEHFQGYVKTELLQEKEVDQEYGIVIDKQQQRLFVYKEGHLFSTLLCSTGFAKKSTPFNETPAGEYIIVSWVGLFPSGDLQCDMGLRINKGIMIHEVPHTLKVNEQTGETKKDYSHCERYLGEKASHGCIRVQKELTPEGVNQTWLWRNLSRKPCTKVIIWDDVGRTLAYPDDDYPLYYNPNKGANYHSSPYCRLVREKFLPLTEFTYGELDEKPFSRLTPCPGCAPMPRREKIDEINEKNNR